MASRPWLMSGWGLNAPIRRGFTDSRRTAAVTRLPLESASILGCAGPKRAKTLAAQAFIDDALVPFVALAPGGVAPAWETE